MNDVRLHCTVSPKKRIKTITGYVNAAAISYAFAKHPCFTVAACGDRRPGTPPARAAHWVRRPHPGLIATLFG
jgi:hypothetical protein